MFYVVCDIYGNCSPIAGIFTSREAAEEAIAEAALNYLEECRSFDPEDLGLDLTDMRDCQYLIDDFKDSYGIQEVKELNKFYYE